MVAHKLPVRARGAKEKLASTRSFVLLILITVVFCVAPDLVPEASAWFVGLETNAAILALGVFTVIVLRVRSVAGVGSLRAGSQIDHSWA